DRLRDEPLSALVALESVVAVVDAAHAGSFAAAAAAASDPGATAAESSAAAAAMLLELADTLVVDPALALPAARRAALADALAAAPPWPSRAIADGDAAAALAPPADPFTSLAPGVRSLAVERGVATLRWRWPPS